MTYTPLFHAATLEHERGRRPDGAVSYRYDDPLELAVNVALASGRPLLLSGAPGTGKSTLAADVAWKLGRRYYDAVITSRTTAQDLQWSFDTVRRLALASRGRSVTDVRRFVQPGPLWWAFEPATAEQHGTPPPPRPWQDTGAHAVVLLDEIDKAQPDVPNDLLGAIDQREFTVRDTEQRVRAPDDMEVLIVITTNGERDLPPAFVRRCVCHEIKFPADPAALLADIARRHFTRDEISDQLLGEVYQRYAKLRADAATRRLREPSTAELLDALRACKRLRIERADEDPATWLSVVDAALWKHTGGPPAPTAGAGAAPASAARAAKDAP